MKTKFILAVVLLMVCEFSHAQFSNTGSISSSSSIGSWSTFYVQWNPSTFNMEGESESESFNGFSLGLSHAIPLSKSIPVYFEFGIGAQYSIWKEKADNEEEDYYDDDSGYFNKINFISAKVPLNLAYKWDIPNSPVSIIPYAGLNFRYNIMAENKFGNKSMEKKVNLFDQDEIDFYLDGEKWKRFQAGWQVGINFKLNQIILGASYGADFSEIAEDVKIHTASVTLGICF